MAYAFGHPKRVPKGSTRDVPCVAAETALLVVDVQEYCSRPERGCMKGKKREDMPYFFDRVRDVMVPGIAALLGAARSAGVEVVYTVIEALTLDGRDASLDYKLSGPLLVPRGHPDSRVLPEVAPAPDEIVLPKTSCSVFCSTNISYVLRNLGSRYLIICGQLTNQCVESAVRDAADLGFLVTVPEDACAAKSQAEHESGLWNMRGFARLTSCAELACEILAQRPPLPAPAARSPRVCLLQLGQDSYSEAVPKMTQELLDEVASEPWELIVFDAASGTYPGDLEPFSGFVVMGSPCSVSAGAEHPPWASRLLDFIRTVFAQQRPLVGVCFGHQAMVAALGGCVVTSPAGLQIGLKSYAPSRPAQKALGIEPAQNLRLFCHHSDVVVTLPAGAESWGYNRSGHWGATWGASGLSTQSHPEFSTPTGRKMLRGMLEHVRDQGPPEDAAFAHPTLEELEREIAALDGPTDHALVAAAFARSLGVLSPKPGGDTEGRGAKRARLSVAA